MFSYVVHKPGSDVAPEICDDCWIQRRTANSGISDAEVRHCPGDAIIIGICASEACDTTTDRYRRRAETTRLLCGGAGREENRIESIANVDRCTRKIDVEKLLGFCIQPGKPASAVPVPDRGG